MPLTLAVPGSTPIFDLEVIWPWPIGDFNATGEAFDHLRLGSWKGRTGGGDSAGAGTPNFTAMLPVIGLGIAGGIQTSGGVIVDGLYSAFIQANVGAGNQNWQPFWPLRAVTKTDAAGFGAGAGLMSHQRVWWLDILIRADAAPAPTAGNGFILQPLNNVAGSVLWFDQIVGATNRGGFGLVGDGAGSWVYESYAPAPAFPGNLLESIVLPAHSIDDWNAVRFVIVSAAGGREGSFQFSFNQQLIASRSWAGGLLPDLAGLNTSFLPTWRANNGGNLQLGGLHLRAGRYTPDGVEIGV